MGKVSYIDFLMVITFNVIIIHLTQRTVVARLLYIHLTYLAFTAPLKGLQSIILPLRKIPETSAQNQFKVLLLSHFFCNTSFFVIVIFHPFNQISGKGIQLYVQEEQAMLDLLPVAPLKITQSNPSKPILYSLLSHCVRPHTLV